jgi:hypothetical protein
VPIARAADRLPAAGAAVGIIDQCLPRLRSAQPGKLALKLGLSRLGIVGEVAVSARAVMEGPKLRADGLLPRQDFAQTAHGESFQGIGRRLGGRVDERRCGQGESRAAWPPAAYNPGRPHPVWPMRR